MNESSRYLCVYDRTIYHNPDNKYCVIVVKTGDPNVPPQARRNDGYYRDKQTRFVAVGYELPRTNKVSMMLVGEWKSGKHGLQLEVTGYEEIVPQTRDGVKGYLSSRLIKGVGPKTAELIVERFGADALHILEQEPEKLLEIRGISKDKLEEIIASYAESRALRDIMILLAPFGITPATATKIYEHFGAKSVEILRSNPFELCTISGFGFRRVDAILQKNNYPLDSPMRINGAIFSVLDTQKNEKGHLYLPAEQLIQGAFQLLNEKIARREDIVPKEKIASILQDMVLHGKLVNNNGLIYPTLCFVNEDETAMQIARLLSVPAEREDITAILAHIRSSLGIALSQRQSEAVYMAFRHPISIITGSPGTGKTTVLRAIIEVFKSLYPKKKIVLAAPTGRASRRMAESTGRDDAKTLHSLLGLLGESGFSTKKQDEPLDADLIIVDESSMIDMWLAHKFFGRVRPGTKLVLVGDCDQLQSVGAGDVFRELIACGQIPVTRLNEIFRQKQGSLIAHNAKSINENETRLRYGDDFVFIKTETQEETADTLCRVFCREVELNGVEQVQILSPYRSDGAASAEQLNLALRETVNPPTDDCFDLKVGNRYFRVGDKVMQNKNNAKASNGDIGFIRKIERDENGEAKVTIAFSAERNVEYRFDDMAHLEHAYASTIHKSQGNEYSVVIIPVIRSHAIMLRRNLIYTAITRAKRKVVLVGQFGMLYMAINRDDAGKRNTKLGERLANYVRAFALKEAC